MTGKINITITEEKIEGSVELRDISIVEKVLVIDAIMNSMDITGFERLLVCDMLKEKGGPVPKLNLDEISVDDLFANLFGQLKEN